MIPVPGFENVKCAWIDIRAHGFLLHGFLLYLASDRYFPQYLDGDGLGDLDVWSGDDCGIFVMQSPSASWIDYAKATDHAWWKLFGHLVEQPNEVTDVLRNHGNAAILEIAGNTHTIREIFAPCLNE